MHSVDSLLCAVPVHVALYVMRCDHGHNPINRLNWLSDNGHAARAVSGYWQSHATLQRWCRIRSYLDSAVAHCLTALDAITRALEGNPWLPPLTAAELAAA